MTKTLFYHIAPGCTPCIRLKPMAEKLAAEYGATFITVNVDVTPPLLPQISSVPTVVIYSGDNSGEPEAILTPGMLTKQALRKALS